MKLVSLSVGLVGCLVASVCAGSEATRAARAVDEVVERHCSGPVTIARQSDVRSVGAFCNVIDGDLRIAGTDVTSLDGLEGVRSVRNLVVINNPKLASLHGLSGLRDARAITVMGNPVLTTLSGLEGLATLDAAVVANNGLTTLRGLDGLRSATDLVVVGNPALTNLAAIDHVEASVSREITGNGASAEAASRLAERAE
jgi:hypothetical protein